MIFFLSFKFDSDFQREGVKSALFYVGPFKLNYISQIRILKGFFRSTGAEIQCFLAQI